MLRLERELTHAGGQDRGVAHTHRESGATPERATTVSVPTDSPTWKRVPLAEIIQREMGPRGKVKVWADTVDGVPTTHFEWEPD